MQCVIKEESYDRKSVKYSFRVEDTDELLGYFEIPYDIVPKHHMVEAGLAIKCVVDTGEEFYFDLLSK